MAGCKQQGVATMFNPREEAMPVPELRKLQGERLKDLVKRAYENVPFYRAKLDAKCLVRE